jgi:hypothetical protein
MQLLNTLLHATRFGIGLTVFIALLLSGCGGGGEDSGGGGTYNPLSVYIDATTPTVQTGSVDLRGAAYCDNCPPTQVAFGYCPPIQGPQSSAIDITWKNRTTGATGSAFHGIFGSCSCLFSYCFTSYSHQWMAYGVPLDIGEDVIEVKASDMSGASATDTVTLTRIPASPVELVALAGKGEVTLSWNSVAGAASYNLYWSTSSNLTLNTAAKIPGVTSPYVHNGLTDGVTYYYFVTAVIGGYESAPSPTVFATPGWHTEIIAPTTATTNQRDTSIATDSAGNAHVHYAYNECTHYTQSNGFWQCDSYSYYNDYITDASGSWAGQPIGPSPYVDANIAVDSGDTVHVGYAGNQGIIHAVYANGTWAANMIDAGGWCDSSLALDATDKAHFVYYASSTSAGELRYATNVSGAWVHGIVDTFPQDVGCNVQPGAPLSLAVDATGTAHIAYPGRYPGYGLKYATNQGGAWVTSTVDTGYIPNLSAAVDANGKTHVAYSDSAHNIKYAHQDASGAWFIEVIESNSGVYPSLALDASGNVHVSYVSSLNGGQLIYATNSTGAWNITPIDGADFADTALALDSLGKVHISYFSGASLKYATNK